MSGTVFACKHIVPMRYLLVFVPALALIAFHNAWQSIECPLLLGFATLACIIIKSKKDEQRQKKKD